MSAPQIKERPASMLRAMFSGLGSLLNVMDKVRSKPAPAAPAAAAEPGPAAEAVAPVAEPEAELVAVEIETVTIEPEVITVEDEIVVVAVEPVAVEPEPAVAEPEPPAPASALPLANYDELSVASLRARLRNLSVAQLTELLGYEQAHAARPDVITMFERRIAKVQAES
jgi:hypothetical protein